jgi:hypothetical protein
MLDKVHIEGVGDYDETDISEYNIEDSSINKETKNHMNLLIVLLTIRFQTPVTSVFDDIIDFHNDLMCVFIFILSIILTFLVISSLLHTGILVEKKFGYASKIDSNSLLEVS